MNQKEINLSSPEIQTFVGDCLDVCGAIEGESVDLVYLDPPFFTNATQRLVARDRRSEFSFDDTWTCPEEYSGFLLDRLLEFKRVLKPTGSLFFHCDRNASHIVRLLLDRVFGADKFQSEIIWTYKRWSNSKKGLLPSHQNILFYTKSGIFTFNRIMTGYAESTNVDQILQRRVRDDRNKSVYAKDAKGDDVAAGDKKGVPVGDVWDIPFLNPKAKERVGYPTQKPLLLLDRIIAISTNEGDTVLDPFCGSGTTLVAAKLGGRSAIGIDKSSKAIDLARKRLDKPVRSESRLLRKGRSSYLTADEDALGVLNGLDCVAVHRNKGIDAVMRKSLDGKPILVRVQKKGEQLADAISLLACAADKRKAGIAFLVKVENETADADLVVPEPLVLVESSALQIRDRISKRAG